MVPQAVFVLYDLYTLEEFLISYFAECPAIGICLTNCIFSKQYIILNAPHWEYMMWLCLIAGDDW
jgi:hypothetical protein